MLSVSTYPQEYIDDCRSRIDSQLSAYNDLVTAARDAGPTSETRLDSALEAFEPMFFNNMVLVLDHYFCHRGRSIEGKDGNALNEVRVLCSSLMDNDGIMAADKTIRLKPASSLLKHEVGDEIKLSEGDYRLLSTAFFAEIESKYL
jgi:hypothetical protein